MHLVNTTVQNNTSITSGHRLGIGWVDGSPVCLSNTALPIKGAQSWSLSSPVEQGAATWFPTNNRVDTGHEVADKFVRFHSRLKCPHGAGDGCLEDLQYRRAVPRRKLNQSLRPSSGSKNIDIICTCLDGLDGRTSEETPRCCATAPARRADRVPGGPRLANRRASRSLRTSRCDGFRAALDCNHKFLHFRNSAVGHTKPHPFSSPAGRKTRGRDTCPHQTWP